MPRGHRKTIRLLPLFNSVHYPILNVSDHTPLPALFSNDKPRLLFMGLEEFLHLALLHLKLPSSQCSEPSPPDSSAGNLCLNPTSKTSPPVSDSGQRLSLPIRTGGAFSFNRHCFSTVFCNPFNLGTPIKFWNHFPPTPNIHGAGSRRAC